MTETATSPASSGPAGSLFEAQVGAYYLLSMLTGAEPRGLPETTIDRIAFQRAAEGRPLDDVIVDAHTQAGDPAILEIQVKRSITFSPSDPVFRVVVHQIAEASRREDFWTTRYELAIATSSMSRKIAGPYQDVLTWARQIGDAATFTARIDRRGSANEDMRNFVRTFKAHLHDAGVAADDETVWKLLRKLHILIFDFTAVGSASEELARERAVRALHPDDTPRGVNLWTTLTQLAVQIAASGGDRTRDVLVGDMNGQGFRLAGQRGFSTARAILAESSRASLADISDRIGDVMLTRSDRVAAVHSALDQGRYIEIRGDAGVGKSGVLKHFAQQVAADANAIVFSPGRTEPRGWTGMRAVLGFDGTAHDLLADLAGDGGAVLFIDNLDFFEAQERTTVIDLVREAANVPGMAVIATARRNFGAEEPNWLPLDAIGRLGRAEPVMLEELSDAEIEELQHAAPGLAPLLADTHPARSVTRNLFRLSRLAGRPEQGPIPRTEIDMAEQWWQTADGEPEGRRERARLLRTLAEQALLRTEPLDVSDRPATVVDSLLASETLRDLKNDRVAFRHDVLREWAIANLLHAEPAMIDQLPLNRPASAALARGVELLARMTLERADDCAGWQALLERLSRPETHGSWRRAVLLALVRSEIAPELLTRVASLLLADRATLLSEVVRIVMAVEVVPARTFFAALGVDVGKIPNINVPSGPAWRRLILWIVALRDNLPAEAIPDIVDLFTTWSGGLLGQDPITPVLVRQLYGWLMEIEDARDVERFRDRRQPFAGRIPPERLDPLENNLRTGFLLWCNRAPELAVDYLQLVARRRNREDIVSSIFRFSGALAQAAPAELADLTATALIRQGSSGGRRPGRYFEDEPFDFLDHLFTPSSPTRGPFLTLLTHSPEHGLSLIHRLVDHAISFYSKGGEYGYYEITIPFPEDDRAFPWSRSYFWAREFGAEQSCITSALMALEAWAHQRVEAGEAFETVLADLLGPPGSPAAYLLPAVDLLISHWPQSRDAAVPFLACPELLCIDRQRQAQDRFEFPDLFGLQDLNQESVGAVNLESLKKRPSRQVMLDQLLGAYSRGPAESRQILATLLKRAATRLGPPVQQSTLLDPNLMVVYALNVIDPANWREVSVMQEDGTQGTAYEYVPPEEERLHFASLQENARGETTDTNLQIALDAAVEDPNRSSQRLAAAAVEWAQKVMAAENQGVDNDRREQSIVAAAMIAVRDGHPDLLAQHGAWAQDIFTRAMRTGDGRHRYRSGLAFNPVAIAFVGMVHLLRHQVKNENVRVLLEVAGSNFHAAAHGFGAVAATLASIDERLPPAVLRCAFSAGIRENQSRDFDENAEEVAAREERHRQRVRTTIAAELAWLAGQQNEPDWPSFPHREARPRRGLRITNGEQPPPAARPPRPEEYANDHAAALWLSNAATLFNVSQRPWLRDIARTYGPWTAAVNGVGLDVGDVDHVPRKWNDAYFDLLAHCLPGLTITEIDELALESITALPERPFFDVMAGFLRSVDVVYFNDSSISENMAISIRSSLADRLIASSGWRRLSASRSSSIEIHLGPAIATIFFNEHRFSQPPKCYLLEKGIDRISPFLPVLTKLIESGSSLYVAVATLSLVEVSPRSSHLPFVVTSALVWLQVYPDATFFWIDHNIGRRVCVWIETVWRLEPALLDFDKPIRSDVDQLLAALVSLGVADARRLEEALS